MTASLARRAPLALAVATLAWMSAVIATPAARAGSGGSRVAAVVFHSMCGRICHQRVDRSFATGGVPWPVCGRCAGLYAGAAVGAVGAWANLRRRRRSGSAVPPPSTWRLPLLAAAAPTAVSWGLEAVGLVAFSTAARFALALPAGALASWAVSQALAHDAGGGLH